MWDWSRSSVVATLQRLWAPVPHPRIGSRPGLSYATVPMKAVVSLFLLASGAAVIIGLLRVVAGDPRSRRTGRSVVLTASVFSPAGMVTRGRTHEVAEEIERWRRARLADASSTEGG